MATKKNKDAAKAGGEVAELCAKLGVKKLYINNKGEYFTERTYAIASEGGDKTKVSCYEVDGYPEAEEPNAAAGASEKKDEKKAAADESGANGKQDNPKSNE